MIDVLILQVSARILPRSKESYRSLPPCHLVNTEQVTAVSSNNVNSSLSIHHGFPVFITVAKKDDAQITKSRTIEEDIEAVKDEWIAERIIAAYGLRILKKVWYILIFCQFWSFLNFIFYK